MGLLVVRARLLKRGKMGSFRATRGLKKGELVLVSTPSGPQVAEVVSSPFELEGQEGALSPVLRPADEGDLEKLRELQQKEERARSICEELIENLGLPMKLVEVEYLPEEGKVIFFFTAEQRVDFRALVKQLASRLRMRIEMRQIGVRDEAKMVGGLGPCGRELCCSTFLKEFDMVTIRMAKEQNLPLNPEKISGVCGRLMCCLTFEIDAYQELKEGAPRLGKRVQTKYGEGKVIRQNILLKTVTVQLQDGAIVTLPMSELHGTKEEGKG